jgi:hypothetical protein
MRMDIQSPTLDSAELAVPEITRLLSAGLAIVARSQHPADAASRDVQPMRAVVRPSSKWSGPRELFAPVHRAS